MAKKGKEIIKKGVKKNLDIEKAPKEKSSKEITRDKIKELEERISKTKYNKKTQHAIGGYKAQIAVLKEKLSSQGKGKGSVDGYSVRKSGDASVVLLGFPSAGKSTLLNKLTNAISEVGSYAFTTLTCVPGMMSFNHAQIQILDVPGIVQGAADGSGRGKEVLQVVRNADLVLILIDALSPQHYDIILKEIIDTNVRINQKRPDVKIIKTAKGGIDVGSTIPLNNIDKETVQIICKEFKISNAQIVIRDDIDADQLIDVIEKNRVYIPAITVVNKMDLVSDEDKAKLKELLKPDMMISADKGEHIEELKELIYDRLEFIRVFLKEVRKKADMEEPLIIPKGSTIKDVCEKLHKDFLIKFKFARIWGKSVRFDGQKIMKTTHILQDQDILELHMK